MPLVKGDKAPAFEAQDQHGNRIKVPDEFAGKKVALIFMRYLGCPLCLAKLKELKDNFHRFAAQGIEVLVVVQSTPRRVGIYAQKEAVPFRLIGDHEKRLYALYEVRKGGFKELVTPNVLKNTLKATLAGHMHGAFEGDELQVPADFLIGPEGRIMFAYYGRDVSDFSPVDKLLTAAG